jgi:hypothetical protein
MVPQRTCVDTFKTRLPKEEAPFEEVAAKTSSEKYSRGPDRKRVKQAEIASSINKWLGSRICGKAC